MNMFEIEKNLITFYLKNYLIVLYMNFVFYWVSCEDFG